MGDEVPSIAVVCEAGADFETGTTLADRVIYDARHYITPEIVEKFRAWRGATASDNYLLWRRVRALAREHRVRAHGHFGGEPGAPDALAARRAMLVVRVAATESSGPEPAAYILLRDGDHQPEERRRGLEQARREFSEDPQHDIRVVVGLADPKREAWILAGFEPEDDDERTRLASL